MGIFALATALCGWLGFYSTFNSFAGWDDEGYLLITVKNFAHHGGLYTHMYSVFGPFYYEALSTVFSWLPVTPDNGRAATAVVELLVSLGFGIAVKMFTRNLLAGVATQIGSFVLLTLSLVDESMHPTMVVWLLFAVALIALALVARGKRSVGCATLGAAVAAMVLTEVNVGLLAGIAIVFTGLTLAPSLKGTRILTRRCGTFVRGHSVPPRGRRRRPCDGVLGDQVLLCRGPGRCRSRCSDPRPWRTRARSSP